MPGCMLAIMTQDKQTKRRGLFWRMSSGLSVAPGIQNGTFAAPNDFTLDRYGAPDFWNVNANGSQSVALTKNGYSAWGGMISPDGDQFLCLSNFTGANYYKNGVPFAHNGLTVRSRCRRHTVGNGLCFTVCVRIVRGPGFRHFDLCDQSSHTMHISR